MREGVTYKRLGEVGTIIGGSTPKTDDPANWGGTNMWVTPAELDGSKYISKTQRMITDKATSKLQLLPTGTVLLSSRAPIGKVAITKSPMYCNQGFKNVVCGDSILNEYVYYCLIFNTPVLQKMGVGATFKEISKSMVEGFTIPVPSLSTQELIVRELDSISSVISAKKQQVLELENLAQAIFLDTFGDPITNPKGWEIVKLGSLFSIGSSKRVYQSEWQNKGVPFYRAREVVKLARDGYVNNELFISEELFAKYSKIYGLPQEDDILVTAVGTLGITYIVKKSDRFYYKDGNIICLHKNSDVNSIYVDFCFKMPFVRSQIDNWNGATVGTYTIEKANQTKIPLPPLSLQQAFAEKVQAIEEQKRLINQSIAEFESLLAQRMEFHFA